MDKIIKRIQHLFSLANDEGATIGESSAALAMAHKLLAQYHLEESSIPESDSSRTEEFCNEKMNLFATVYDWEKLLLHIIAEATFCEMVYDDGDPHFLGRALDVTAAHYLYRHLRQVIINKSKNMSLRDNYCKGLVIGLSDQIKSFRLSGDTSLVPVGLEDYVKSQYPSTNVSLRRFVKRKVSEEFRKGIQDGKQLRIRNPLPNQMIAYRK